VHIEEGSGFVVMTMERTGSSNPPREFVGLVYIAAVAAEVDETVQSQLDPYPTDIFGRVQVSDGCLWMQPNAPECFAGDLSAAEQKLIFATHDAPVADLFQQQKLTDIAWKSKPSWYLIAQQDRTVHPELQRFLAGRMKATVTETNTSHVPLLSKPEVVLGVIRQAAASVAAK